MNEIQRVREEIDKAVKIYGIAMQTETEQYPEFIVTDQILSIKGLCVEADDQTAPTTELHENSIKGVITQDYLNGRLSLLKAGFKKVL